MNAHVQAMSKENTSLHVPPFDQLYHELVDGLQRYWFTASTILAGSGITLREPSKAYLALGKNFFTMLFLYSYYAAGIRPQQRPFYVAVNQCLRGMVTGCDNILDDEYKQTLDTDLPSGGTRFRSVLDIMVSDRVLFELLLDERARGELTDEQVRAANAASLRALTASGAQEATEEGGVHVVLSPDDVLSKVHHYKTGILFQCPWAVPAVIENIAEETVKEISTALYRIGMGCQILDDMVDLSRDLCQKRHNYVRSLIVHGDRADERTILKKVSTNGTAPFQDRRDLVAAFPRALGIAVDKAREFLETGTHALYTQEDRFLAKPTIAFIAQQIGADRYLGLAQK